MAYWISHKHNEPLGFAEATKCNNLNKS